jgi:sulfonate transport system substrate-binding protein
MPSTRPSARWWRGSRRAALTTSTAIDAALALALAVLVSACGGSGTTSTTPSGQAVNLSSVSLRVGATGWTTAAAALKIAGLDNTPYKLSWPVFSGGDKQMQALQAGALDVGSSSEIPPIFAAASADVKFKVVAVQRANTLLQEVIVGKNSTVTSIAGLKGKKVGYVKNTTAQYFLYKLLEQAGLKWTDITAAPLLPNDGVAALSGGSIDAFASYGNSIITAHQNGARTIGSGQDILSGNFPWEASAAVIADPAKKAALVDLLVRITKAYAYIRAGHAQDFAAQISQATHEPVDLALSQLRAQEQQRPSQVLPTSPEAIASQQAVADAFTTLGAIPKKLDISAIWTDTLNADLRSALSAAGLGTAAGRGTTVPPTPASASASTATS